MQNVAPWNYGNYYLGNTTMQMMPLMLRKVQEYGLAQAMATLRNGGILGGMAPVIPMIPPMMPMGAPLMAAATPLPVAFSPLVHGMYPAASMSPVNWMAPSSFMSALTTGPMPYRPPGFEFPSSVGMVMAIPYGTPNPMISASPYTANLSGSTNYSSMPYYSVTQPVSTMTFSRPSYYPQPTYTFQSAPNPVSTIPQPNISAPTVPLSQQPLPVGVNGPLLSTNVGSQQTNPMYSSTAAVSYDSSAVVAKHALPIYDPIQASRSSMNGFSDVVTTGSPLINAMDLSIRTSLANEPTATYSTPGFSSTRFTSHHQSLPRLNYSTYDYTTSTQRRDPIIPPILVGELISDSGWLPKESFSGNQPIPMINKKQKRTVHTTDHGRLYYNANNHVSFLPKRGLRRRRVRRSNSSASDYDCVVCQEKRDRRRLKKYFGKSAVSSLFSSKKTKGHRDQTLSEDSLLAKLTRHIRSSRDEHRTNSSNADRLAPVAQSTSPVLVRQSTLIESTATDDKTVVEEKSDDEMPDEVETIENDREEKFEHSTHDGSHTTLNTIDE